MAMRSGGTIAIPVPGVKRPCLSGLRSTTYAISAEIVLILLPVTVGLLAAFVAYGRWRMAPLHKSSSRRVIRSPS